MNPMTFERSFGLVGCVGLQGLRGLGLCALMVMGCAAPLSEEECLELAPSPFCLTYVSDEPCPDEVNGIEVNLDEGRVDRTDGSRGYCCREVSRECVPPELVGL